MSEDRSLSLAQGYGVIIKKLLTLLEGYRSYVEQASLQELDARDEGVDHFGALDDPINIAFELSFGVSCKLRIDHSVTEPKKDVRVRFNVSYSWPGVAGQDISAAVCQTRLLEMAIAIGSSIQAWITNDLPYVRLR